MSMYGLREEKQIRSIGKQKFDATLNGVRVSGGVVTDLKRG